MATFSKPFALCSRRDDDVEDVNVDNNAHDDEDEDGAADDDDGDEGGDEDVDDVALWLLVDVEWNGFAENSLFIAMGTMSSSNVCLAVFVVFVDLVGSSGSELVLLGGGLRWFIFVVGLL